MGEQKVTLSWIALLHLNNLHFADCTAKDLKRTPYSAIQFHTARQRWPDQAIARMWDPVHSSISILKSDPPHHCDYSWDCPFRLVVRHHAVCSHFAVGYAYLHEQSHPHEIGAFRVLNMDLKSSLSTKSWLDSLQKSESGFKSSRSSGWSSYSLGHRFINFIHWALASIINPILDVIMICRSADVARGNYQCLFASDLDQTRIFQAEVQIILNVIQGIKTRLEFIRMHLQSLGCFAHPPVVSHNLCVTTLD